MYYNKQAFIEWLATREIGRSFLNECPIYAWCDETSQRRPTHEDSNAFKNIWIYRLYLLLNDFPTQPILRDDVLYLVLHGRYYLDYVRKWVDKTNFGPTHELLWTDRESCRTTRMHYHRQRMEEQCHV